MPFYLRYSMSTGSGRREASSAEKAAEIYAELRLAGATIVGVTDDAGRTYELQDLVHDPMELAEIERLTWQIALLRDRLTADADGSSPRTDEDAYLLRLELERARAQLARVVERYK